MEPQTNTASPLSAKNIFVLVILLIISSAIGAVVGGKYYPREKVSQQAPVAVNYSVPTYSNVNTNPIQEIHTIMGTVESIKGNTFTLKEATVQSSATNLQDLMIIVNSDTKIIKGSKTEDSVFQKEAEAYMKRIEDTKKMPVLSLLPEFIKHVEVGPEEVKIGDNVIITTAENIGTQSTLFASKIQIEPKPEKPPKK